MALVTLLIGGLALIGWLRTPTVYLATRSIAMATLPAGTPSSQDSDIAQQQTLTTARLIVSPGFRTATAFDQASAQDVKSSADISLRAATPTTLGRALSASHASNTITLAARWGSATGAEELVTAAADVLASGDPAILALFGGGEAPRFLVTSGSPHTFVDEEAVAAARNTLLLRLALAVLAGALVMGAVALMERRRYETEPDNGETIQARKYPPAGRRTT